MGFDGVSIDGVGTNGVAQVVRAPMESVGKAWEEKEVAQMVWVLRLLALMGLAQMVSVQKVLVQIM